MDDPSDARLFLALWPDAAVLDRLRACSAALAWPGASRPEPANRLHLTLHFIGAVPRSALAEIADALAVEAGPIALDFDRIEVWNGKVAVLLPKATPAALAGLHAALASRLGGLGLAFDPRAYRPHVTLGRKAGGLQPGEIQPLRWASGGYALMESRGDYVTLRRYP